MTPGPIVLLRERPAPEVHLTPLNSQAEEAVGRWNKGCLGRRSSSLSSSGSRGSLFHTTGPELKLECMPTLTIDDWRPSTTGPL